MKIIFLSSPLTHKDPTIMKWRIKQVNRVAALLFMRGEIIFSPLSHSDPIQKYMTEDHIDWYEYDLEVMRRACNVVYVLMLDGWKESVGVKGEIEEAERLDLPVVYLDPNDF